MTAPSDERRDLAERLRPYFEAQLLFAERMAAGMPLPLAEACLTFTNMHRRFGFGRVLEVGPSAGWLRYADGLDRQESTRGRLAWTIAFFLEMPPEPSPDKPFGCFSHEPPDDTGTIRIHFHTRDIGDGHGPLARHKTERRLADLKAMFAHIQAHSPQARTVRGGSWLYNLEAYCRLFPPEYVASRFEPESVRLDGTSSWGQLLDFRGCVKPAVRDALLANLDGLDMAAPWRAFPLRALGAQCGIEHFLRFYGV